MFDYVICKVIMISFFYQISSSSLNVISSIDPVVGGGSPSFDFPLLGTWSSLFTHKPLDLADEYGCLQGLGEPFELQTIY